MLTYTFADDANNLKNGVYHIGNSKNMPFSYGTLIQFGSDSFENGYITQLAMDINTKKVYARGHLSGTWSDWVQL